MGFEIQMKTNFESRRYFFRPFTRLGKTKNYECLWWIKPKTIGKLCAPILYQSKKLIWMVSHTSFIWQVCQLQAVQSFVCLYKIGKMVNFKLCKKDTFRIFENCKFTYVLPSYCLLKHFLSYICQGTSGVKIRLNTYNNIPVMIKVPVESIQ